MMEVVNGMRCVLWVLQGVLRILFCVLLCMLLYILEAGGRALEVLEVMRCCMLQAVEGTLCLWRYWSVRGVGGVGGVGGARGARGDSLCATLCAGGRGG